VIDSGATSHFIPVDNKNYPIKDFRPSKDSKMLTAGSQSLTIIGKAFSPLLGLARIIKGLRRPLLSVPQDAKSNLWTVMGPTGSVVSTLPPIIRGEIKRTGQFINDKYLLDAEPRPLLSIVPHVSPQEISGTIAKRSRGLLHKHLTSLGFKRTITDPCVYTRTRNGITMYLACYVDDLLTICSSPEELLSFEEDLKRCVKKVEFKGEAVGFLGMESHLLILILFFTHTTHYMYFTLK
jgi:hypothetical protein